jgi:hypothetical protein
VIDREEKIGSPQVRELCPRESAIGQNMIGEADRVFSWGLVSFTGFSSIQDFLQHRIFYRNRAPRKMGNRPIFFKINGSPSQ